MKFKIVLLCFLLLPMGNSFSLPVPQSHPSDTVKSKQYVDEAKKNFGKPKLADSLARLAFQLAGNNFPLKGESAHVILYVNLFIDYDVASQWADSAIYYFQGSKNDLWTGYTLRMLGTGAQRRNKNDLAIKYYQEGLGYFEKANDTLMMAENNVSLSLLYHNNIMDFKKGMEYGLEALRIIESQHGKREILNWRAINAVAINYDDSKEWDKALAYHQRNLSFENPEYKNSTLNNIGNTLRKKGEFKKAHDYFMQSLALISRDSALDISYDLATVYLNLTQVSSDLQNMKMAFFYNDSSLHYAHKSNNVEKLRDSYEIAYQISQKQGSFKRAFGYLQRYMEIKDSVLNKDKAEIIYEMETRFQSEKKERQITQLKNETLTKDLELQRTRTVVWWIVVAMALIAAVAFWLFKRNQYKQQIERGREQEELQRQRFSAVVEAEENERARVAKDLHDGLGQLLSSAKLSLTAVSLPPQDVQGQLVNNSINVLDQATNEVRAISHNLMPAALMALGLKPALDDMFNKINESKLLNVKFIFEGIGQRLPPPIEVAVYRVIQEVINNMIKHSKASVINVGVMGKGDALHLSISDNGVGFEKDLISRSKGLGWKSIFSRIDLLKGKIEVDTQPGKGTNINIQFAIA